ncbi:hypothetical protein OH491_10780 [Termitidicoccus mucosus]|uniref:Uncharacterized protein n=1 Tax=Termitidicoccus mucosus TaxID=1184151 RepID=A0A178IEL9_9BACT|nr:hypothetical protein AW736_16575 [Opitutaceae bacterium TSB47]
MKITTLIPALAVALLALVFAGCSTIGSRIKEKAAVFDTLTPEEQASIRQGSVGLDYTIDMVYMALGKPDHVTEKVTSGGADTTWIYNNYYQEYAGTHFVGYRRHMTYDAQSKRWIAYYVPIHEPVYRTRIEEIARVQFKDGKVIAIEQPK